MIWTATASTLMALMLLQSVGPPNLDVDRLDTLIELAEANREVARLKSIIDRIDRGAFRPTDTTDQLEKQLAAARSIANPKRVQELEARLALAKTNLKSYYENDLNAVQGKRADLKKRLREIQSQLDTPPVKPPVEPVVEKKVEAKKEPVPAPPQTAPANRPSETVNLPSGGVTPNCGTAEQPVVCLPPPTTGTTITGKIDHLPYVYIPAGTFQMGCADPTGGGCHSDELPSHAVTISKGFWLGQHEVTAGAYWTFSQSRQAKDAGVRPLKKRPMKEETRKPITGRTYGEASLYCHWAGGRLPKEAEWEYAARAGATTAFLWGEEPASDYANFASGHEVNVMSFKPNAWQLYDMFGNVGEFVADSFVPYAGAPVIDPVGPISLTQPEGAVEAIQRVVRGGSWATAKPADLRASIRTHSKDLGMNALHIGFRCAIDHPIP